ncbi:hypothetical protein LdCL_220022800 [Leishmania donovani]|uniref:Uncharacterized protein n=1 Tax=Leishmania donovani TaxID=5661 RepID=A0A3Q8ICE1_LEIDO|nr:hypothetical protein LdCL_220022800 [Leishmania donovani]
MRALRSSCPAFPCWQASPSTTPLLREISRNEPPSAKNERNNPDYSSMKPSKRAANLDSRGATSADHSTASSHTEAVPPLTVDTLTVPLVHAECAPATAPLSPGNGLTPTLAECASEAARRPTEAAPVSAVEALPPTPAECASEAAPQPSEAAPQPSEAAPASAVEALPPTPAECASEAAPQPSDSAPQPSMVSRMFAGNAAPRMYFAPHHREEGGLVMAMRPPSGSCRVDASRAAARLAAVFGGLPTLDVSPPSRCPKVVLPASQHVPQASEAAPVSAVEALPPTLAECAWNAVPLSRGSVPPLLLRGVDAEAELAAAQLVVAARSAMTPAPVYRSCHKPVYVERGAAWDAETAVKASVNRLRCQAYGSPVPYGALEGSIIVPPTPFDDHFPASAPHASYYQLDAHRAVAPACAYSSGHAAVYAEVRPALDGERAARQLSYPFCPSTGITPAFAAAPQPSEAAPVSAVEALPPTPAECASEAAPQPSEAAPVSAVEALPPTPAECTSEAAPQPSDSAPVSLSHTRPPTPVECASEAAPQPTMVSRMFAGNAAPRMYFAPHHREEGGPVMAMRPPSGSCRVDASRGAARLAAVFGGLPTLDVSPPSRCPKVVLPASQHVPQASEAAPVSAVEALPPTLAECAWNAVPLSRGSVPPLLLRGVDAEAELAAAQLVVAARSAMTPAPVYRSCHKPVYVERGAAWDAETAVKASVNRLRCQAYGSPVPYGALEGSIIVPPTPFDDHFPASAPHASYYQLDAHRAVAPACAYSSGHAAVYAEVRPALDGERAARQLSYPFCPSTGITPAFAAAPQPSEAAPVSAVEALPPTPAECASEAAPQPSEAAPVSAVEALPPTPAECTSEAAPQPSDSAPVSLSHTRPPTPVECASEAAPQPTMVSRMFAGNAAPRMYFAPHHREEGGPVMAMRPPSGSCRVDASRGAARLAAVFGGLPTLDVSPPSRCPKVVLPASQHVPQASEAAPVSAVEALPPTLAECAWNAVPLSRGSVPPLLLRGVDAEAELAAAQLVVAARSAMTPAPVYRSCHKPVYVERGAAWDAETAVKASVNRLRCQAYGSPVPYGALEGSIIVPPTPFDDHFPASAPHASYYQLDAHRAVAPACAYSSGHAAVYAEVRPALDGERAARQLSYPFCPSTGITPAFAAAPQPSEAAPVSAVEALPPTPAECASEAAPQPSEAAPVSAVEALPPTPAECASEAAPQPSEAAPVSLSHTRPPTPAECASDAAAEPSDSAPVSLSHTRPPTPAECASDAAADPSDSSPVSLSHTRPPTPAECASDAAADPSDSSPVSLTHTRPPTPAECASDAAPQPSEEAAQRDETAPLRRKRPRDDASDSSFWPRRRCFSRPLDREPPTAPPVTLPRNTRRAPRASAHTAAPQPSEAAPASAVEALPPTPAECASEAAPQPSEAAPASAVEALPPTPAECASEAAPQPSEAAPVSAVEALPPTPAECASEAAPQPSEAAPQPSEAAPVSAVEALPPTPAECASEAAPQPSEAAPVSAVEALPPTPAECASEAAPQPSEAAPVSAVEALPPTPAECASEAAPQPSEAAPVSAVYASCCRCRRSAWNLACDRWGASRRRCGLRRVKTSQRSNCRGGGARPSPVSVRSRVINGWQSVLSVIRRWNSKGFGVDRRDIVCSARVSEPAAAPQPSEAAAKLDATASLRRKRPRDDASDSSFWPRRRRFSRPLDREPPTAPPVTLPRNTRRAPRASAHTAAPQPSEAAPVSAVYASCCRCCRSLWDLACDRIGARRRRCVLRRVKTSQRPKRGVVGPSAPAAASRSRLKGGWHALVRMLRRWYRSALCVGHRLICRRSRTSARDAAPQLSEVSTLRGQNALPADVPQAPRVVSDAGTTSLPVCAHCIADS